MIDGPIGWKLTPEGAAVHLESRTSVIADVHLGYEWSRARGGDALPAHSLRETVAKLASLLDRVTVARLIVAGDLVESSLPCPRTDSDVRRLTRWLADRGVSFLALRGNHDPRRNPPLPSTFLLDGWTIGHGDRPIRGTRIIFGHHHPILRADGLSAPCFLFSETRIVLPAFSPNAAGLDVASTSLPTALRDPDFRCAAGLGGILLDFGPVDKLTASGSPC